MNDHQKAAQIIADGLRQAREDKDLDRDAKNAMIRMSEQNWAQRHWIWWAIISAIIGGVITKIIDGLPPIHI